jgi:hypothetical protein
MGAKCKSKTHLLNAFFLTPFFAHLASKFEKSANMYDLQIFFGKHNKKGIKTRKISC